jgi:hypothetical protein
VAHKHGCGFTIVSKNTTASFDPPCLPHCLHLYICCLPRQFNALGVTPILERVKAAGMDKATPTTPPVFAKAP